MNESIIYFETHILLVMSSKGQRELRGEKDSSSALKEWLVLIKLHETEPAGDKKEGQMVTFLPLLEDLGSRTSMCSHQTLTNEVITFMWACRIDSSADQLATKSLWFNWGVGDTCFFLWEQVFFFIKMKSLLMLDTEANGSLSQWCIMLSMVMSVNNN